jgi:PPOX class probable F420-dependent enzyme
MTATDPARGFGPLEVSGTALLTTFRRGGEEVGTPVSIAVNGDRAYFVTPTDSGKARRLAGNPRVTLAPCTVSGRVRGESVGGRARRLEPAERRSAAGGLLGPTKPLFWSLLLYRLQGNAMDLYEVVPADIPEAPVTRGG